MREIGSCLRSWLKRKGMSQKELAISLGMTKEHISTICLNKRRPSLETLERICEALDLTFAEFFADPESPSTILSEEEFQILNGYRKLREYEKKGVSELIDTLSTGYTKDRS